ncbi:eCIS core domain-containing protein [Paractinoplanes toevensis]|uniref:eCIS core domain-containing protein n=1 Tax=Paractinoplanes toevensis TaxID=571911 RepID=A0A919TF68_9ACTN|nr:DUF4157 domain-containing protein [Actinoplanes toevensis]GIM94222.1 hypothetical protein Ato02nite_060150 [Actinoplanes toevensis]
MSSGFAGAVRRPGTEVRDAAPREPAARKAAGAHWPAWVQRCGIGSTCGCGPEEKQAGIERDLQQYGVQRHPVTVGPLDDPYERQAADVASAVGGGGRVPVRRAPQAAAGTPGGHALGHLVDAPPAGRPVAGHVLAAVEPMLGQDLSGVRVHADEASNSAARDIGAKAFTHGNHIFLGAGQSDLDVPLMAHELTHTVQQGGGPAPEAVQRLPSLDDIADAASAVGGGIADAASAVGEGVVDAASAVGEGVVDAASAVGDAAVSAADAVAGAGQAAWDSVAGAIGDVVSLGDGGLVITPPDLCLGPFTTGFDLPPISGDLMVPVASLSFGPVSLDGSIGVTGAIEPKVELQLGPVCLTGVRIVVDPLGESSTSGTISAAVAGSLGAEVRAGLRGELELTVIVPIEGIPVPITVPLVALEGGAAGLLRGIVGGKFTAGGKLGGGWGHGITLDQQERVDLGIGADLFLGAYGQLDLFGKKICRLYWEPYAWHGDLGTTFGLDLGIDVGLTHRPRITPKLHPPERLDKPFQEIGLALSRGGFRDDCPIIDKLCDFLRTRNLLPSRRGGRWDWTGDFGPGPRLPGPLEVYPVDPRRASRAKCRGACGKNCNACSEPRTHRVTDPATGDVWEYTIFTVGGTHNGCREHDAAFDWAAQEHDETGPLDILMPWHMAANVECLCNNLAGNCLAWIAGLPPHDGTMNFADMARVVAHGNAGDIDNLSEEELLDRCAKGLLPPDVCKPLEDDMISRFGNRRRNLGLDPDKDPKTLMRPDDAPILEAFRRLYNRLDSWSIVIRTKHPDLEPEFRGFDLEIKRDVWLKRLKAAGKTYKEQFRDLREGDTGKAADAYHAEVLGGIATEIDTLNREIAAWYARKTGSTETVDEIMERVHVTGTELWREEWRQAILQVNRILALLWPPARTRLLLFVGQQRSANPGVDLGGEVGQLDYIGSLATGFKGPPKQQIRFNPQKFDVDANLEAPPLAKFALFRNPTLVPDRGRIFGRVTTIEPLHRFTGDADAQFRSKVKGYDASDPFDVALTDVPELPTQTRERLATERMFELRTTLDAAAYQRLIDEVDAGGYLEPDGTVRKDLSEAEFAALSAILDGPGQGPGSSHLLNRQDLIDELARNGVKHNPEDILEIGKDPSGKIIFLEKGNSRAGLQHILERHAQDFANVGVPADKVGRLVFEAVVSGQVVGTTGRTRPRPVYEVVFEGQTYRVTVTVAVNGFIVGANPVGS